MILLQNKGEIELDLIKTMGVNVKENDDSIGFFGTGLKYAIAVFLREGIDIQLFIGSRQYEFVTETKTIRGKSFHLCRMIGPMDSVDLGFTTDLGKNWELWQAYREIHSNCLDENGEITRGDKACPMDGFTTFAIGDIKTDGIFLEKENKTLLYKNDEIEIYEGLSSHIYYKGIRSKDLRGKGSIYTYNINKECSLTEDRLLAYDHQIDEVINDAVASMGNRHIIKNIITNNGNYEESLCMELFCKKSPGDAFASVIASKGFRCNHSAERYFKQNTPAPPISESKRKIIAIDKIRDICDASGFDFSMNEYDINIKL